MIFRDLVNVLKNHDECSVVTLPSEHEFNKLKKMFNCEFKVKQSTVFSEGYVIYKVKKENK